MQKIDPGCRPRVVLGRGLFASSIVDSLPKSFWIWKSVRDSITRKLDCAIRSNDMPLSAPAAIIAGGETTVKFTGNGRGGRSQEFVLSAAMTMPQAQSQIASR